MNEALAFAAGAAGHVWVLKSGAFAYRAAIDVRLPQIERKVLRTSAHETVGAIGGRRFRVVPGHPVVPDPLVTLRARHGLKMTCVPRFGESLPAVGAAQKGG